MISRKKFAAFAALTIAVVFGGVVLLLLAADLVLHHRAERSAGLNRWGYRGPVLGDKQPGEVRAAMLGGSTAFGYGVMWNESIPSLLEHNLNQRHPQQRWSVVNLAYNTEGAYAFLPNLRDFAYLDYDIVILYEGYNDLFGDEEPNRVTVRQQSPLFRRTGYFPILPLWLQEKSTLLRTGTVQAQSPAAGSDKTVFRPSLTNRASASALDAAASVAGALERQFEGSREPAAVAASNDADCPAPWPSYCASQGRAIDYAITQGKRVLVVSQPNLAAEQLRERHGRQQQALAGMVRRKYGSDARVAYFALGDVVDVADTRVSFDQMHLNVDGNRIVANALVEPVVTLWSKR